MGCMGFVSHLTRAATAEAMATQNGPTQAHLRFERLVGGFFF
jgi:hypothetical protein